MFSKIFKNLLKSSLVFFFALILSNFLPSVLTQSLNPTPKVISSHKITVSDLDLEILQSFLNAPIAFAAPPAQGQSTAPTPGATTGATTGASTTTTPGAAQASGNAAGVSSLLPAEFQEVANLLRQGNYTEAIQKAKEGIDKLVPYAGFFKTISYPLFIVIGTLLDNQIFASPVMKDVLGTVWSQVRNLCYYILLIYFVFIAIYNVFTGSSDSSYSLKKGIQEIIIAFIVINFSWFGAMLTLDVSNVAINITYSWATQYDSIHTNSDVFDKSKAVDNMCELSQLNPTQMCQSAEVKKQLNNFLSKLDQRSLPLTMALRFGRVLQVDKINTSQITSTSDPFTLVSVFLVKLFIFLLQFFSYLMLAYYLIIRIIYVWVYIALSPVIVLDKVLSGLSIDASEHFQKFFDYALIGPIKGGVGFTLSYIILDAIERTPTYYDNALILNSIGASIGALDSFQTLLVYFASVAVIYEITLNMADGTAAASAFTWLRGKVEGTAGLLSSAAANTGVFVGGNSTSAKALANKLFPDASVLDNPNNQGNPDRNTATPQNTIAASDDIQTIIRKFQIRPQTLNQQAVNTILANPAALATANFTPQALIDQARGQAQTQLTNLFSPLRSNRTFQNQDGATRALRSPTTTPAP